MVEPLRCQYTVGVLSEPVWMVRSRRSKAWTRTSWWAIEAASSRSELVTEPAGLSQEMRASWMYGGNGERHRIGACTSVMTSMGGWVGEGAAGGVGPAWAGSPRTEPGAAGGGAAGGAARPRTEPEGVASVEGTGRGVAAGGGPENVAGPTITEPGLGEENVASPRTGSGGGRHAAPDGV